MNGEAKLGTVVADKVADDVVAATSAVARRAAYLARLLGWDESLLLGMRRFHAPWRTRIAHALTRAGDARSLTAAGVALMGAGLALRSRPVLHVAVRFGAASLAATAASQALKRSLTRRRPTSAISGFTALAENPDAFSFPSGHTSAAFAIAAALHREPFCAGPVALLLAVGIGLSRVYLGAHYPLDVAAGAALGSATGVAVRIAVP
jgi:undecaprenyl-diphosphatase